METITDNDLKMFQERARTEFASRCDTGGIAWDSVIWDLCNEVRRLRSVAKECGDAAHKREVDALKQRCAELDAEVAAKDEVIKRLNDAISEEQRRKMATAEKSSAVGDCAKLREALSRVLCWLKRMNAEPLNTLAVSELTPSYAVNRAAKSIIEGNNYQISQLTAALAAPPRNCDKVKTSWDVLKEWHEGLDTANDVVRLLDWLLAPATDKEGGNDENE